MAASVSDILSSLNHEKGHRGQKLYSHLHGSFLNLAHDIYLLSAVCFNVYGCFVCMYVCICVLFGALEGQKSASDHLPGTGVRDHREPPCICWELNPGPLEEPLLLTTEPSLMSSSDNTFS